MLGGKKHEKEEKYLLTKSYVNKVPLGIETNTVNKSIYEKCHFDMRSI